MSGFSVNYTNDPALGDFNDLYLDNQGNLATVFGETDIIETCYHALQLTVGDYDYNLSLGIPYDTYLSSDSPVGNQIKLSMTTALTAVVGVQSIGSFTLDVDRVNRKLLVNIVINLINGNSVNLVL